MRLDGFAGVLGLQQEDEGLGEGLAEHVHVERLVLEGALHGAEHGQPRERLCFELQIGRIKARFASMLYFAASSDKLFCRNIFSASCMVIDKVSCALALVQQKLKVTSKAIIKNCNRYHAHLFMIKYLKKKKGKILRIF